MFIILFQTHANFPKQNYHLLPTVTLQIVPLKQSNCIIKHTSKGYWGTRWRRWSRYCDTSWKVARSVPDGVIAIFHLHNPSSRTMACNRNEYPEYFLEGKGGRCVGLTTLPPSCADYLEILEPQPPGTLRACPGL